MAASMPVRVVNSATCGRKLVATARFAPGHCILEEFPYAYVLKYEQRELFCAFCLKQCSTLKKCSSCKYVSYCSTTCETDDRARCHNQDCNALESNGSGENQDVHQVLSQIIRKHEPVPRPQDDDCFPTAVNQLKSYDELSSHLLKEHFDLLLKQFIEEDVLADIELSSLSKMYGATLCNLFTIRDNDLKGIADGIYLRASMANHSCDPNCVVVYDERKLQLRTIKDVTDGEECTISYLIDYFNNPTKERQALLPLFTCKCGKCMETNALEPNEVAEVERLKKSKEGIDVQIKDASKSQDWTEVLQKFEPYLKSTASSCLPADHHLLVEVREIAFEIYMKMESWDKAAQMGQLIIQPYRDHYGPYHPTLGVHLLKMGKLQIKLKKLEEARKYLPKAEKVLEVSHGNEHSQTKLVKELLNRCRFPEGHHLCLI